MIIGDIVLIWVPKKSNVANKPLNIFEFVLSINENTKSVLVAVKHGIIGREHPKKSTFFISSSDYRPPKGAATSSMAERSASPELHTSKDTPIFIETYPS